jgi:hypothetical protein
MKGHAKVQLSAVEKELVNDTGWIFAKHSIIKKVFELFGGMSELMKCEVEPYQHLLPVEVINKTAKITRGENYKLLPYVILDYPAFFDKDNIFAIRTMFWWGNFFSITLHTNGVFKSRIAINPGALLSALKKNNFYVCVNHSEWQHHFESSNYSAASSLSETEFKKIVEQKFFKVATKISLTEWDNAEVFLIKSFREMLELIQINFQVGEKDLSPVFPITGSGP